MRGEGIHQKNWLAIWRYASKCGTNSSHNGRKHLVVNPCGLSAPDLYVASSWTSKRVHVDTWNNFTRYQNYLRQQWLQGNVVTYEGHVCQCFPAMAF